MRHFLHKFNFKFLRFSNMMESTRRSYAPRFDVSHSSIGSIPSIDLTIMEEGDLPNDSVFSNRPPATVHTFSIATPPPSSNASRAYAPFVLRFYFYDNDAISNVIKAVNYGFWRTLFCVNVKWNDGHRQSIVCLHSWINRKFAFWHHDPACPKLT